jgi:membrane-associated phospholipid phosphatase
LLVPKAINVVVRYIGIGLTQLMAIYRYVCTQWRPLILYTCTGIYHSHVQTYANISGYS